MEFYYQGVLRWSYGFENPNKAAALIASLLPFCWLVFTAKSRNWKIFGWWLVLLLGGWFLLIKTYSRGGVVAAAISQLYVLWFLRTVIRRDWHKFLISGAIAAAALAVMFTVSGLGARHVESVGDASVHNRFTLWQGGLAMLADTPMGVGAGNSGRVYMDWYQPLTATEGYRTLVNSYLTFATEQGLVVFGGVLALFGIFWLVTGIVSDEARGARKHWFIIASQGALLAFLVAGFFSTTMESTVLWLPPLAAVALLAWVFLREEKDWPLIGRRALIGAGGALMAVLLVYGMGGYFQSQETLSRQFYFKGGELVSARLQQKQSSRVKSMAVWVDREVLGTEYGKPLRQILAQGLASEVEVFDANDGKDVDAQWLVYCGSRCRLARFDGNQRVVLIMPLDNFEMDSSRMKIITSSRVLERSSSKVLEKLNREGRVLALGGAEKNVLWYWDEILSSGIWD